MEAATRLDFHQRRRRRSVERELQSLRPQGEAFLLRRYGHSLSRPDIEDAVADVIIRLHRKIETGGEVRNLRAAFFTSVRNAAIDQLRSRSSKPTAPLELVAETSAPDATPIELAEGREDSVRLREALDRMRPNYREAILLRFGAGLTVPEIAERLQISLPAAKKLVLRSTAQIRKRLEAIEGQEFCPEMRDRARRALIDRELNGLASDSERRVLQTHFEHCGTCRSFLGDLHRGLHEIGGAAALTAAAGAPAAPDHLGRLLGSASEAFQAAGAKARLASLKLTGALGPGDASSIGALSGTAQKIAAVCSAGAATATCLATGVVGPGIGGVGVVDHGPPPPAQVRPASNSLTESPSPEPVIPTAAEAATPEPEPTPEPSSGSEEQPGPQPEPDPQPTPSEAASEEFGFEAGASASSAPAPAPPAPPPSPPPAASSGGGGGGESFGFGG